MSYVMRGSNVVQISGIIFHVAGTKTDLGLLR